MYSMHDSICEVSIPETQVAAIEAGRQITSVMGPSVSCGQCMVEACPWVALDSGDNQADFCLNKQSITL